MTGLTPARLKCFGPRLRDRSSGRRRERSCWSRHLPPTRQRGGGRWLPRALTPAEVRLDGAVRALFSLVASDITNWQELAMAIRLPYAPNPEEIVPEDIAVERVVAPSGTTWRATATLMAPTQDGRQIRTPVAIDFADTGYGQFVGTVTSAPINVAALLPPVQSRADAQKVGELLRAACPEWAGCASTQTQLERIPNTAQATETPSNDLLIGESRPISAAVDGTEERYQLKFPSGELIELGEASPGAGAAQGAGGLCGSCRAGPRSGPSAFSASKGPACRRCVGRACSAQRSGPQRRALGTACREVPEGGPRSPQGDT